MSLLIHGSAVKSHVGAFPIRYRAQAPRPASGASCARKQDGPRQDIRRNKVVAARASNAPGSNSRPSHSRIRVCSG